MLWSGVFLGSGAGVSESARGDQDGGWVYAGQHAYADVRGRLWRKDRCVWVPDLVLCRNFLPFHGFGFCFSSGGIMRFGFQSHFERDDSIVSNVKCGELGISICVLMCGELVISLLREAEF